MKFHRKRNFPPLRQSSFSKLTVLQKAPKSIIAHKLLRAKSHFNNKSLTITIIFMNALHKITKSKHVSVTLFTSWLYDENQELPT